MRAMAQRRAEAFGVSAGRWFQSAPDVGVRGRRLIRSAFRVTALFQSAPDVGVGGDPRLRSYSSPNFSFNQRPTLESGGTSE